MDVQLSWRSRYEIELRSQARHSHSALAVREMRPAASGQRRGLGFGFPTGVLSNKLHLGSGSGPGVKATGTGVERMVGAGINDQPSASAASHYQCLSMSDSLTCCLESSTCMSLRQVLRIHATRVIARVLAVSLAQVSQAAAPKLSYSPALGLKLPRRLLGRARCIVTRAQ